MAKRYEKYKDSGIAWIGEIPEHWSVKRLNDIGKYRKGPFGSALKVDSFIDKSDDAIKVYEQQNAIKKSAIIGASYISKEYFENNMKGFEVCANDIIVSCAGTIGELFVLPSNIEKGIINQALMRMRMDCRYVNLSFFLYIFDILLRVESEQSSNGSAMKNIPPFDILKKIRIPLANISEQEQIAKYLDWKCGEIDRIVEVRERQIKLLGELRTSVISRAVTRGLTPNAPLKDSGIDWIGQIPEHWEICRLKNACSLKGRIGWKGLRSEEFEQISYAYLVTGQDFHSAIIDWTKCYQISKERYDEDPYIQLSNGDLLITKDGTIGKIAKVSNMDKPSCLNSGIFVMKQTKALFEQSYLYWLLESSLLKEFNNYTSTGTTILHLYQNVFENMPFIIPSLSEQQQIAEYLDKKTEEIDSTIDKFKVQIDKLKEYRQALITEVVTGKIDVRGIKIPTPKSN
ncbi:restriction endonuclease subunit S [Bacteroides uniformis]|uniref:Restriction endonuclease subunit S n=1 Tax=Bacteroides uniformis TaxID=820 RepID=A0A7J5GYD1_BACUN|nr:restriction endonuclease subunit S [Bacteroides uniformis]KAB4182617.1 restriction endonuclease subunit S [Bacteroides uniformis]